MTGQSLSYSACRLVKFEIFMFSDAGQNLFTLLDGACCLALLDAGAWRFALFDAARVPFMCVCASFDFFLLGSACRGVRALARRNPQSPRSHTFYLVRRRPLIL